MDHRQALLVLRTSHLRRGIALGAVAAAAAGLVLLRSPRLPGQTLQTAAATGAIAATAAAGSRVARFRGEGMHGTIGLSHGAVLASGEQRIYAEVTVVADAPAGARARAPVAMVIALDTSGSMAGDKIRRAREAAVRLIDEMDDDDQIAFVRYASEAEVVQPLARVRDVRAGLLARVRELDAAGGTNIPLALEGALGALREADAKRVRRVVLVSDGQDSGRKQAERAATQAAATGVVVSSLGVGLDFDERYMAAVAQRGRGNFAFLNGGEELTAFLHKELQESATTVVDKVSLKMQLPEGVSLGAVSGTSAEQGATRGELVLPLGSLFAGEERRFILELVGRAAAGEEKRLEGVASWDVVASGDRARTAWSGLAFRGTADQGDVDRSIDGAVLGSATSVLASLRQLRATEAYARGDQRTAQALIEQNLVELRTARAAAPEALGKSLDNQAGWYAGTWKQFEASSPSSDTGRAAAKRAYERDNRNFRANDY
jgi:Ca-activated chloride channel homolog